ncbi:MAG: hypothetical protein IT204_03235 [Fimbriimonadaceae bacterium]|nr:hypothetical protein [Fimbriimonadaceae bacterium]
MGWAFRLLLCLPVTALAAPDPAALERSYWVHASLGLFTQRGYFGPDYPASSPPTEAEVTRAVRLLAGPYAANRLYLIYHQELPLATAREVFRWWRAAAPAGLELVPTVLLRMYDPAGTPVFSPAELAEWVAFCAQEINPHRLAVFDIYADREQGPAVATLAARYPEGLLRVGLQPSEPLGPPFVGAVQDTWSGFCHGTRNVEDWLQPGFGAALLRDWVTARNGAPRAVVWDLIVVAWDYRPTERGGFPGYDDAERNMPLPAGRTRLGVRLIRDAARPEQLGGFSSDLYIVNENSRAAAHDGRAGAFYQTLRDGRPYEGYYRQPFDELTAVYRELAAGRWPAE